MTLWCIYWVYDWHSIIFFACAAALNQWEIFFFFFFFSLAFLFFIFWQQSSAISDILVCSLFITWYGWWHPVNLVALTIFSAVWLIRTACRVLLSITMVISDNWGLVLTGINPYQLGLPMTGSINVSKCHAMCDDPRVFNLSYSGGRGRWITWSSWATWQNPISPVRKKPSSYSGRLRLIAWGWRLHFKTSLGDLKKFGMWWGKKKESRGGVGRFFFCGWLSAWATLISSPLI